MALEKIGVGAVFTFDEKQGVKGLNNAKQGIEKLRDAQGRFLSQSSQLESRFGRLGTVISNASAGFKTFGSGLSKIGGGIRTLSMALLPSSFVFGLAARKALTFERQLDAVGSVSRANAEEMKALSQETQRMGIVSKFTATQAAEGAEILARAGARPTEIIAGLSGVMNAAAADAIDMDTAANAIAISVKGLGLEWNKANHIADVLALTSASANTNITLLTESFTYGVPAAKVLGIELEELSALFGKMGDAGLKGSIAGTAFSNMMVHLAKPNEASIAMLKKWNVSLTEADGTLRKVSSIVDDVSRNLDKMPKVTDRAAAAAEIFGLRGMKGYNALAVQGKAAIDKLEDSLMKASEGVGAAEEMANRRLSNFLGQMVLLTSALEGFAIQFFETMLEPFTGILTTIKDKVTSIVEVMKALSETIEGSSDYFKKINDLENQHGKTIVQIVLGVKDAMKEIRDTVLSIAKTISKFSKSFADSFGKDGIRNFVKIVFLIGTITAVAGPLLLSFVAMSFVISGLIPIIEGVITIVGVLASAWLPVTVAIGAVGFALILLQEDHETFGETVKRVWGEIKAVVVDFNDNVIKPVGEGMSETWVYASEDIKSSWLDLVETIRTNFFEVFDTVNMGLIDLGTNWQTVGSGIVTIVTFMAKAVIFSVKAMFLAFNTLTFQFRAIRRSLVDIISSFRQMFSGDILGGLKRLHLALVDFVLIPFRNIVKMVVNAAKALGVKLPEAINTFAEEGFTGITGGRFIGDQTKGGTVKATPLIGPYGEAPSEEDLESEFGIAPAQTILERESVGDTSVQDSLNRIHDELKSNTAATRSQKQAININNKMCVDGESMNVATAKHKIEVEERSGAKATPWQRRQMIEYGATSTVKVA